MKRTGATSASPIMDDLVYTYTGNQLTKIKDNGHTGQGFIDKEDISTPLEYTYDSNGNLTKDYNKGMTSISYGYYHNLPTTFQNGPDGSIQYTYDANGVKLRKASLNKYGTIVDFWDYIGPFVYHNNAIHKIATSEGRLSPNGTSYSYEYDFKDHLGNVRMSFDKNPTTGAVRIIQEDHYYPFGMQLQNNQFSYRFGTLNYNLFNGKEKQEENGLNLYDYGARFYNPEIGRWMGVDPLADNFPWQSSYCAMDNDPINFNDPTGMDADPVVLDAKGMEMQFDKEKMDKDLFGSFGEKSSFATCPTCPNDKQWDDARNSKNLYTYNTEINSIISGDGSGVTVVADRFGGSSLQSYGAQGGTWDASFNSQTLQAGFGKPNEHWIGPALYAAGQPINMLKPVGALSSSAGSSIASYTLSKVLPFKSPLIKQVTKQTVKFVGEKGSTAVLGRAIGRFVPVAGLILTTYDVTKNIAIPMSSGVSDYTHTYKNAGLIYHVK